MKNDELTKVYYCDENSLSVSDENIHLWYEELTKNDIPDVIYISSHLQLIKLQYECSIIKSINDFILIDLNGEKYEYNSDMRGFFQNGKSACSSIGDVSIKMMLELI